MRGVFSQELGKVFSEKLQHVIETTQYCNLIGDENAQILLLYENRQLL